MADDYYYETLGLNRAATLSDVRRAYKQLALKHHPDKDGDAEKFEAVCEAYWVLGDLKKRAVYDQYGYEALRDGIYGETGDKTGGWTYPKKGLELFDQFFGTQNPFHDFDDKFAARLRSPPPKKLDPITKPLECTLEEIYNGCVKTFEVTRKRRKVVGCASDDGSDPRDYADETRTLTIHVKPGWKQGTKITFACEGDEGPNLIAPDLVFELVELPHPSFERRASNLVYTARLTLGEALVGTILHVPTLDGRQLAISCPEVVSPGYEKSVPGEGMPVSKNPRTKGNLIIRFQIAFPKFVPESHKPHLTKILNACATPDMSTNTSI
ncbi:hypothetical protein CTAYLR_000122 [Chrysophaeum taylorii]|uniref:J domain-containing protein n=1 Tax=Chrysophaeum taylorii TaxID=2483200 RepID=A0AAD7XNB0_9STRA|nr:hypothetical protein CTAYLR_000122 [Chrysophaeum taylorii]